VGLLWVVFGGLVLTMLVGEFGPFRHLGGGKPGPEARDSSVPSPLDHDRATGTSRSVAASTGARNEAAAVQSSGVDRDVRSANIEPSRLEDATGGSHTRGPQSRQDVHVADRDRDGELGLQAVLGGAVPGDDSLNVIVKNPKAHTHWLKVKLIATKSHRQAMGARIQVDLKAKDGEVRSIYRTVGNNSSFGGNSLVELIGLGDATYVDQVTVSWPISRDTEVFHKLAADQFIEITEGAGAYRVIHQKVLAVPVPST